MKFPFETVASQTVARVNWFGVVSLLFLSLDVSLQFLSCVFPHSHSHLIFAGNLQFPRGARPISSDSGPSPIKVSTQKCKRGGDTLRVFSGNLTSRSLLCLIFSQHVHILFTNQAKDHQLGRPPHLPHMPGGPMARPADQDRYRGPPPARVGLPHGAPAVPISRQTDAGGDQPKHPSPPRVGLPHGPPGVVASGRGDQAMTNGDGAPNSQRHSVPSLHPAPRLGLPHVSAAQTLPHGAKPPTASADFISKTTSLDRKDAAPPVAPKSDKKRHSVLGIFKKSKKEKEKQ